MGLELRQRLVFGIQYLSKAGPGGFPLAGLISGIALPWWTP